VRLGWHGTALWARARVGYTLLNINDYGGGDADEHGVDGSHK